MNLGIETEYIEFKESVSQLTRGLESLSAMLNKHGKGRVFFGVKDNGDVCGLQIGNRTITDISRAVSEGIKPTVVPIIQTEVYDGKVVILLEAEGNAKPYAAYGEYLIRSGNENRKIEPELLREILFQNTTELITNMESIRQDLSFHQLKRLYLSHGLTIDDQTFERNMNLLTERGKYNKLAELLADENDISIKVVRFRGQDKSEMLSRDEYGEQCLLTAMKNAYEHVSAMNETRVQMDQGMERKETRRFDSSCLDEAWTNACLHNRWARSIPPVMYVFSNRIEIVSTGGLPFDLTEQEFFQGISHPVNLALQRIMGQLGLVEQTGHGVPKIISVYGKEAFQLAENHITVTIPFAFPLESQRQSAIPLTKSQKTVYDAIREYPTATIRDLKQLTSLSESRINQVIRELKQLNIISREGSRKSGYWKT